MAKDLFQQAHACFLAGQHEQAEALYRQVLQRQPGLPQAHHNLGIILATRGNTEEAIEHYRQALRGDPKCAQFYNSLGNVLFRLGRNEEAVEQFTRAIELDPSFAEPYNGLGGALLAQGRAAEAIDSASQAVKLRPNYASAHFNRGLGYLTLGDYERGWPGYEWRWGVKAFALQHVQGLTSWPDYEAHWLSGQPVPPFRQPRWDGSPLGGRIILLWAEQGLGDTIQLIRYAPLVKARGGNVWLQCQRELRPILAGCAGIDVIIPSGSVPDCHVQAPLGSLPYVFGTTASTIPAEVPYLRADTRLVDYWRQQLPGEALLRIGIVWQGSPRFQGDLQRSIPLAEFAPLAALPGVQLISLQKGHGRQQIESLPERFPLLDLGDRLDEMSGPFMDTAALMQSLDLVITANTAIAHLAGALGVPVWIALPSSPEWRWLLERSDSPWYPTARLFRQQRAGDWNGVFAQIARELREKLGFAA